MHVAGQGWSSTWIADGLERRPGYERLHELVDYATNRLGLESLEDPAFATYECTMNGPEAMAWLDENRPDVAAALRSRQGNMPPGLNSRGHGVGIRLLFSAGFRLKFSRVCLNNECTSCADMRIT
jgi:hypothetical protein